MMTNGRLPQRFLDNGTMNLRPGAIFAEVPKPIGPDVTFDPIQGMLLGLAIGDALGKGTEAWLPQKRRAVHGEITDYLPHPLVSNQPLGLPSDDTQLAFWTLQQLLEDGRFIPERLAARFCRDRIYGLGGTVRGFLRNYKERGLQRYQCGPRSAGNGSLMRIAPILLPHLPSPSPDLWADTALAAMITHNDAGAIAACLAFVKIYWELLSRSEPPPPSWWPQTYVNVCRNLEEGDYQPRGGAYPEFSGPIWRFAAERLIDAYNRRLSVLDACDLWYSGAYLVMTTEN